MLRLMEHHGKRWSTWAPVRTLPERLARTGRAFCRQHGLDAGLAAQDGQIVQWVYRAMLIIIAHLGHREFRRPYEVWRRDAETRKRWYVGIDEAERQIIARQADKAAVKADINRAEELHALNKALHALGLKERGWTTVGIAEEYDVNARTVRNWLRRARAFRAIEP